MTHAPSKFRKKPVVIEAIQVTDIESSRAAIKWINDNGGDAWDWVTTPKVGIQTLEGTMTADKNDWIIRGVGGEFYPCKPNIFAATYDAVPA